MSAIHGLRAAYESLPAGARGLVGPVARFLPTRVRYGGAFVSETDCLRRAAASADFDAQLAEERLQFLMRAALRTPYWSAALERAGLSGRTSFTIDDLRQLPLVDKQVVREHHEAMLDPSIPESARKYVTTGGTSGRPLGVWIDKNASPRDWAHVVDAWNTLGYRLDDRRAVLRGVRLGDGVQRRVTTYEPLRRELYVSVFDLDESHLPDIERALVRFSPRFLHGYPSALEVLGRYLRRSGAVLPALKGIFAVSENLYPGQREYLESLFGVPVVTFYGMSEKVAFAAECAARDGYHVHEMYGHVDLVAADGTLITEPGVRGEIVATGLISAVMPLIRYRTGDFSSWRSGPCPCGRPGRRLGPIEGRWNREYLVTRSGSRVHMAALNLHSSVFDNVERYRFVQSEPGCVRLLLVPGLGYKDADGSRIQAEMDGKLSGLVEVELVTTTTMDLTQRGKGVFIEQLIPDTDELGR